jgi:hypothetical protein
VRDVARVDGEQSDVLFDPFGGEAVKGTLCALFLVANQAADADDAIVEAFRGRQKITDADLCVIEIGMEDGRKHAASRRCR